MRKQTKIAAVVSAAALLALGASMTSFAAAKGTWMMVDGEWYCYDKNGDAYENTFCSSNGKEYFVGEDGQLVRSSWVEYDNEKYFVNSSGAKITNDWRLTTPMDEEDADEEWFYFQSTGKMATNKKITYKGKTYFFDSDGKMLTGWVTAKGKEVANEENSIDADDTYYCGEDGARLEKAWIYTTEPTAEDNEADADEHWYYLKSSGNPVVNKKQNNLKGQSYIFDKDGVMLSGWVAGTKTEVTSSNASSAKKYKYDYVEIDGQYDNIALSTEKDQDKEVYYCGGEDDGHVKKNKWIKTWRPADTYDEDEDVDKYWYWIEKDGQVFVPETADATATKFKLADGKMETKTDGAQISKKKVGSKNYFFNQDGEMMSQFMEVTSLATGSNAFEGTGMYYLGGDDDGAMKTGAQTVKDDNGDSFKFYFGTRTATKNVEEVKGVGITGNKGTKLYFKGLLITADDYKYQTATVPFADGTQKTFIVNKNGGIQHSAYIYTEDGEDLINAKAAKFAEGKDVTDAKKYSILNPDEVEDEHPIDIYKVILR